MENIYSKVRKLASSIRFQNLFAATKEINGIQLFHNSFNLSNIQNIFLSYLYNFDSINRDIIIDKIREHVFDSEIYEDSYLLWKRKNIKKINKTDNKQNEINLVMGKHIKFPKRV
jgi:hypothetical protein